MLNVHPDSYRDNAQLSIIKIKELIAFAKACTPLKVRRLISGGHSGQRWIRTTEVERQRIYSPPHLAALESALSEFWSR